VAPLRGARDFEFFSVSELPRENAGAAQNRARRAEAHGRQVTATWFVTLNVFGVQKLNALR